MRCGSPSRTGGRPTTTSSVRRLRSSPPRRGAVAALRGGGAGACRAIGQFRWRAKEELLRRGLDDASPAARGSALLSLELLSRDHPSSVNSVRPLLHKMLADEDENSAVRRLAVMALKNGSAQRDTIVLLEGLSVDGDERR